MKIAIAIACWLYTEGICMYSQKISGRFSSLSELSVSIMVNHTL